MSGNPNTTRNSRHSSGMLRKNSTQTSPTARSGATGLIRMTATRVPITIAPMKLSTAMDRVIHNPAISGDRLDNTISIAAQLLRVSRWRDQEPGTDPTAGGAGASPSTTVPMVAFHRSAHDPSSSIVFSQAFTNSLADGSSLVTPMPYGSTVNGSPTTLTAGLPLASLVRIDWSMTYASARPWVNAGTHSASFVYGCRVAVGTWSC